LIPVRSGDTYHPFLDPGWTLSFELVFYLCFACTICLGMKRLALPFLATIFAGLVALGRVLPEFRRVTFFRSIPLDLSIVATTIVTIWITSLGNPLFEIEKPLANLVARAAPRRMVFGVQLEPIHRTIVVSASLPILWRENEEGAAVTWQGALRQAL
jgi:hypothetical protein